MAAGSALSRRHTPMRRRGSPCTKQAAGIFATTRAVQPPWLVQWPLCRAPHHSPPRCLTADCFPLPAGHARHVWLSPAGQGPVVPSPCRLSSSLGCCPTGLPNCWCAVLSSVVFGNPCRAMTTSTSTHDPHRHLLTIRSLSRSHFACRGCACVKLRCGHQAQPLRLPPCIAIWRLRPRPRCTTTRVPWSQRPRRRLWCPSTFLLRPAPRLRPPAAAWPPAASVCAAGQAGAGCVPHGVPRRAVLLLHGRLHLLGTALPCCHDPDTL